MLSAPISELEAHTAHKLSAESNEALQGMLDETQRTQILRALEAANGAISGPDGAAAPRDEGFDPSASHAEAGHSRFTDSPSEQTVASAPDCSIPTPTCTTKAHSGPLGRLTNLSVWPV